MSRKKSTRNRKAKPIEVIDAGFTTEEFARGMPLALDLPGILFVEATQRIDSAVAKESELRSKLLHYRKLVAALEHSVGTEDDWTDLIRGVSDLEPDFAAAVREAAVADVLLVTAAEAYINAVAGFLLKGKEADHFEKLSPVGKWLFLPRIMSLKWKPRLGKAPLQDFADLVARRNRIIHPREISVRGVTSVDSLLDRIGLDVALTKRAQQSVVDLIRSISLKWSGSYGPGWLDADNARARPPCFYLGTIEVGGRLGRRGDEDEDFA